MAATENSVLMSTVGVVGTQLYKEGSSSPDKLFIFMDGSIDVDINDFHVQTSYSKML